MIVDTSALIAIIFQEPGFEQLCEKISRASQVGISAPTLTETGIVLSARMGRDARGILARLLRGIPIDILAFGEAHYQAAVDAWLQFGKGRHPASLNFGGCFSYATAKLAHRALLCVGDDFPKTDIELA